MDQSSDMECPEKDVLTPKKNLSLNSLIVWNVKKIMEINASINLKDAMQSSYQHLEEVSYDVNTLMAQSPVQQHLACAILAWQRLGHTGVESLISFIQERTRSEAKPSAKGVSFKSKESLKVECSNHVHSVGPVVRIPKTKIVMHMENPCARHQPKKKQKDIISKIEPCCMDAACIKRLTDLDTATGELRKRAARLAKREAERVELLERAEAAWRDLEVGYQRRLTLSEEKEDELTMQIKKLIDDRNGYKNATNLLIIQLKERTTHVEKERQCLTDVEKSICNKACERLKLSEQAAQGDAAIAELHCRGKQLDRELLYKEEQARRKVLALENEMDSIRGLTLEAERAMRSELSALKEQMTDVSKQLLFEENKNNTIRADLDEMRQEKMNIIEDLDGCKVMCDGRMQKRFDALKEKREKLNELKNRVIECECKLPQDASVEVKRTPSIAALCHCSHEDKVLDSCSCMSLRSELLSNLLSDLFSGLQSELGGTRAAMPCQLLKCLEDRHNWDRGSVVKTNLRNFFAQLLIGELDIAICTSIEKYHAKWIGACCTDNLRAVSVNEDDKWQERAIERRAQKLAAKLAEELFKERADLMAQKAKDIMKTGPPPCECTPQQNAAVYPCLVKTQNPNPGRRADGASSYLKKTIQDVTNIKSQIEDLKKESIKKEDLRQMEEKLARIIQRVSKHDKKGTSNKVDKKDNIDENTNKVNKTHDQQSRKYASGRVEKHSNRMNVKKKDPSVAVNLCLCDPKSKDVNALSKSSWNPHFFTELTDQISTVRLTKPVPKASKLNSEKKYRKRCPSKCACLHKIPSNKSIDILLDALKNWKCKLNEPFNDVETNGILERMDKRSPFDISFGRHNGNNEPDESQRERYYEPDGIKRKRDLPLFTLSEYMGAVNLERSDENVCKCLPHVDNEIETHEKKSNVKCVSANLCKDGKTENKSQCTVDVNNNCGMSKINDVQNEFINKIVKDSQLFSNDCEYDIKFLGATLYDYRNTKENKQNNEPVRDNTDLNREKNNHPDTYDSLQRLFDDDIIKCDKMERANIKPIKESCICCTEQQNDLECNTFHLLEDYLRDRLKQMKATCKSSCIKPKDEEKLYSTVLSKVKDFICNTQKFSCKCLKNCENDRWTRVYGLLQEYLRMKIQRAECTCTNQTNELPNVLDEVTDLINNDFERLKDLCVCMKTPNIGNGFNKSNEIVEEKVRKEISSFTTNIDVVNTSCSPVSSACPHMETLEKITSCRLNTLYLTDSNYCNAFTEPCLLAANQETDVPSLTIIESNTSRQHNIELKQPYIGCTLNCENNAGCIRTKSLMKTNDTINKILQYNRDNGKLSYIMRAVPIHGLDNDMSDTTQLNDSNDKPLNCDTQTSLNDVYVMKNSNEAIDQSNNDTNTEVIDRLSSHLSFVSVNDEALTNKNTLYNTLFLPVGMKSDSSKSSLDCECDMVPVCHVKILVDNIENNLKNCLCVCDTMSSQVCPVHRSH